MSKIAQFIKESVEWLVAEQQGCCTYKLNDHLAICVGWSEGYGKEKRDDVIQAKDDPDWGIDAGVKVVKELKQINTNKSTIINAAIIPTKSL